MYTTITLVVALCSGLSMTQISQRLSDLKAANPETKINVRFDRKATCDAKGQVIRKKRQD